VNESPASLKPKRSRFTARRLLLTLGAVAILYVGSFALNSGFGGYWDKPERDGRDHWNFGLSIHTAILWQPRFGYWAPYRSNWLGEFYSPLILLDRRFVHPTRYVSDPNFSAWFKTTTAAEWHPQFRYEVKAALQKIPQ
jgi:hypothetical protein